MKTQHILVTVLVLSLCQWSVLSEDSQVSTDQKGVPLSSANDPPSPTTITPTTQATDESGKDPTTVPPAPNDKNTTTSNPIPPTTPTTPAPTTPPTTSTTTTAPTPAPNTTTPAPPTPPTTTTTPAPPTTSSTAPTPTTTTPPPPTPKPPRHFDTPSFIGGIVLTIGLIAIGFVAHKIYKSKFDRNYHTL